MDLDLRLLRYFVAVAEDLHFGHAATRLHISQPALSNQIRKLECELGVELLRRDSRHVELTEAGEVFLEEARHALAAGERAVDVAHDAAHGRVGRLVVGFLGNAAAELTPFILRSYQRRHQRVEVELRQFDLTDPLVGLEGESVDVGFVRLPLPADRPIACELLFEEPRVLVLSSRHPLAGETSITVDRLLDEPFLAPSAPTWWRDFWLGTEYRGGHPVNVAREVATVDECLETIVTGGGVAFNPLSIRRFYRRAELAFAAVPELSGSRVGVAWRLDHAGPLVRDFIIAAREVAAECQHLLQEA